MTWQPNTYSRLSICTIASPNLRVRQNRMRKYVLGLPWIHRVVSVSSEGRAPAWLKSNICNAYPYTLIHSVFTYGRSVQCVSVVSPRSRPTAISLLFNLTYHISALPIPRIIPRAFQQLQSDPSSSHIFTVSPLPSFNLSLNLRYLMVHSFCSASTSQPVAFPCSLISDKPDPTSLVSPSS